MNITLDIKTLRKLANKNYTPLMEINFENDEEIKFIYLEPDYGMWAQKEYVYQDFETGLKEEILRLGK